MTSSVAQTIVAYYKRFGTVSDGLAKATYDHHDVVALAEELNELDPGAYQALVEARRNNEPDTSYKKENRRLAEQADPDTMAQFDQWDEPRPFVERTAPPTFPVDALPDWIAAHAVAVADDLQVPVDLCAQLAIGALAAAAMGHANINLTGSRWTEPANLYLATAMHSGAGKSPAEKAMCGALRQWEAQRVTDRAASVVDAERRLNRATKKAQRLETELLANKADEIDVRQAWDDVDTIVVPSAGRLISDDVTPERLAAIMAANDHRQAILSTEADLIDMASGLYADKGRGTNLGIYLKAWSGDDFRQDRKGSDGKGDGVVMAEPLLTVSITMQPAVVERLRGDANLVGRGFMARFMIAAPASMLGDRDVWTVLAGRPDTDYDQQLTDFAERLDTLEPVTLGTDEASGTRFLAWCAQLETRLGRKGDLHGIAEWTSKAKSSVLRTALLLALVDESDAVTDGHMERALDVGDYWVDQMAHIVDVGTLDPVVDDALAIVDWAWSTGEATFKPRDLSRSRRRFQYVTDMIPALELLVEHGWAWVGGEGIESIGVRRSSVTIELHPLCVMEGPEALTVSGQCQQCQQTPVSQKKSHEEEEEKSSLPLERADIADIADLDEIGPERADIADIADITENDPERADIADIDEESYF